MKAIICIPVLLALFISAAKAQTVEPAPAKQRDVLVAGLQAGIMQSNEDPGWHGYLGRLTYGSGGAFGRYYAGRHLAVEAGVYAGRSAVGFTRYGDNNFFPGGEITGYNRKVSASTVEVPVQLQWHFFSPGARFRPFAGAGLAYISRSYSINEQYIHLPTQEIFKGPQDSYQLTALYYQFVQGFTYKLSPRFMLSETLLLQASKTNTTDFGIRIGVGYTW